jgi:fumarate reductase subunit D
MKNVTILLLILPVVAIGLICLQLFLSKKESKWFGLILPMTTFAFSLIYVLNIMDTGSLLQNIILIISTLLTSNIFTIILLAIYFAGREKMKRKAHQLEKMNIQDLE